MYDLVNSRSSDVDLPFYSREFRCVRVLSQFGIVVGVGYGAAHCADVDKEYMS